jgi:hypothetical protein
MLGKVEVWYMTEEERLAYVAKYPIKETPKPKGVNFDTDAIDHERVKKSKKADKRSRWGNRGFS